MFDTFSARSASLLIFMKELHNDAEFKYISFAENTTVWDRENLSTPALSRNRTNKHIPANKLIINNLKPINIMFSLRQTEADADSIN